MFAGLCRAERFEEKVRIAKTPEEIRREVKEGLVARSKWVNALAIADVETRTTRRREVCEEVEGEPPRPARRLRLLQEPREWPAQGRAGTVLAALTGAVYVRMAPGASTGQAAAGGAIAGGSSSVVGGALAVATGQWPGFQALQILLPLISGGIGGGVGGALARMMK